MKILALVTARKGSKRLHNKNIRLLGNKPLIVWTINSAKNIPEICDILVSTDDQAVMSISKDIGAYVPWLRPVDLATDTASSVDVALHALNWYESERGAVDGILLLQPTSPFRSKETIQRGIELFKKYNCLPVLGVSPVNSHPMWTLKMSGEYLIPFLDGQNFGTRAQNLPLAYEVNGSFYLITPSELRVSNSFLGKKTIPLVINSPRESIDIDTDWDFKIAEFIAMTFYES